MHRDQVDPFYAKEETNHMTVHGLWMAPLGNIEEPSCTETKRMCTCHADTASFVLLVKATNFFVAGSTPTYYGYISITIITILF